RLWLARTVLIDSIELACWIENQQSLYGFNLNNQRAVVKQIPRLGPGRFWTEGPGGIALRAAGSRQSRCRADSLTPISLYSALVSDTRNAPGHPFHLPLGVPAARLQKFTLSHPPNGSIE